MKTERELFEGEFKKTNTYKTLFDFIVHHNPIEKSVFVKTGKKYKNEVVQASWEAWQASASREGYKLVPVEPTKEMLIAADCCDIDGKVTANNIYKAMIEAA